MWDLMNELDWGTRESVNEFNVASILQVMESSVEIMCESSEDMTRPSEIMIFNVSFQ